MKRKLKRAKRALRRPFEWLGIALGWLVFAHVSHRMLFRICDFLAAVGYRIDRAGRELSRENLRLVVGEGRLTPRREELILKRSYRNMMRTIGHVFWTSRKSRERAAATGEFSAACLEFLAANRPAITVSGHLGCWEILSQLVYLRGRQIVSVAKDIGTPGMTDLLMKSRRSLGQTIVRAEGAFHPLLQGLQDGADVGLLVDQVVKADQGGVWVRYFGKPVPVSAAPAFLQAKTHAPIVIAWSRPLKDGRYRCEMVQVFPWTKGVDIWGRTQDCLSALEHTIRRHPSCWVMNYRYFRKKPSEKELAQLATRECRRAAANDLSLQGLQSPS